MTMHVPIEPISPGEYIKDEMEARDWTHDDLAEVMQISRRQVINLLGGQSGITPDMAYRLADAFGHEAETWMNLQVAYELSLAGKEDRDIARRAKLFNKMPVREVVRRGWIEKHDDVESLEADVCRFLEIPEIDSTPSFSVAARKGTDYESNSPAHVAWYAAVRHLGLMAPATTYDENRIEECFASLRMLAAYPEDLRRVPKMLADFGIRFVLVQHLKGTRIDGVAMWANGRPIIGMSLRYDRIDNFWFTLFHEMVHIKYRHESPIDVDIETRNEEPIELLANSEAASYLIDQERLESFIARNMGMFYKKRVVQFAQARGVHPAIVVGQLKHLEKLPPTHLHALQAKTRDHLIGQALTDGWGHTPLAKK